jgi:aspartate dehydrogenase
LGRAGGLKGREAAVGREPLKVGLAGLGAVGLEVARRIDAGVDGLALAAISVRDPEKARRNLLAASNRIPIVPAEALAETCDLVVECLPPALFRAVAVPAIERGRIFMPLSVGQLLENWDLVARAKETGARILAPTGALIGLDAVRAAAEGNIRSVTMITRKPPGGLDGARYLVEHGISVKNLQEPLKVFDGTAREGARGFPENVNVAAALSLAGIGPDRTRLEIWADPALNRNTHRIEVDADTASFSMAIQNVPSENPKTGRIVALSTVAALRGLVAELKVGT